MQYPDSLCRKHRHMGNGGAHLGNTIEKYYFEENYSYESACLDVFALAAGV